MRTWVVVSCLVGAVWWSGHDHACAQSTDAPHVVEARERVARGEDLFARGDYDAALAEFEAAYDAIGEHPSRYLIQYNIAQCHERRFRYDLAITYYRRYLELGGTHDEGHEAVEQTITALESLLSHVDVTTTAAGARVLVDGRDVGAAPGEVLVPAGLHTITLRAPGHVDAEQALEVPASGHLDVTLEPARLSDEYRGISPVFAIAIGGLAVVSLGVGIGLGVAALTDRGRIDAQLADPVARWSVTNDSFSGIRSLALGADVSYAGAALFGITALVLGILGDWSSIAPRSGSAEATAPRASLRVGPGGVSLVGAF